MTKWTQEEIELLNQMLESGTPHAAIADRLGRSLWSIRKFKYDRLSLAQMPRVNSPRLHENSQVIESGRPDAATLAERDRRYAAPARDLTAILLGDPRIGYSALDGRSTA